MRSCGRRAFLQGSLAFVGLSLLSGCSRLPLQPARSNRLPRLGFLAPNAPPPNASTQAFLKGLADLGWVDGETIAIEYRWAEVQDAARRLDLDVQRYDVQQVSGFSAAIGQLATNGAQALFTLGDSFLARNAQTVVSLAAQHRLPGLYEHRAYPDAGGLMSYGANIAAGHYRAASYVDKILKGARPSDLPVEQPTLIEFVVNLKAAQALGLTLPQNVLAQATETIQ